MKHPLAVEKRQLHDAKVPSTVYRVETRSGETRTFTLPTVERRYAPSVLERADSGDDLIHIRGHAAVFGRKSEDLGGFREVINPGAFKDVLDQSPDVRALIDHIPHLILGRTTANTLDLREDPRGLHYYVRSTPTSYAKDLELNLRAGNITQSSFAFSMGPESRERWEETEDGEIVRTIIQVDGLFDVSPVTYPAYTQTDASPVRANDLEPETRAEEVPTDEAEPEASTADVAADEPEEGAQRAAEAFKDKKSEILDGVRRRLTIAKSR